MTEPGVGELVATETPAEQFKRRLVYQNTNNRQMFGLKPDEVLSLYRRQSERLKRAFDVGETREVVENAPFRFVANVGDVLQDFGLLVNLDDTNNRLLINKQNGQIGELLIVGKNPDLNIKGDYHGEVKIILKPNVYEDVLKQVYRDRLDKRVRGLLYPNAFIKFINKFRT